MATYTAQGRWFLTQGGDAVVPESDPTAATLYCTPGLELDAAEAARVGLIAAEHGPAPAPEHKAVRATDVEDKSARRGGRS